jgi:hypothetical protein
VFPVGRALEMKDQLQFTFNKEPPKEACQAASSPCLFPDGRVFGCIGPLLELGNDHPLFLGNARNTPLHEIFDHAEGNVILHALRLWGPYRLFTMLRKAGFGAHLPKAFVEGSTCNACYALMADPRLRHALTDLAQSSDFQRQVSYGRLHYLDEAGMLEVAGVGGV